MCRKADRQTGRQSFIYSYSGNVEYGTVDILGWLDEFHTDYRDASVSKNVFKRFIIYWTQHMILAVVVPLVFSFLSVSR